jgi:hypothetical protein
VGRGLLLCGDYTHKPFLSCRIATRIPNNLQAKNEKSAETFPDFAREHVNKG